MRHQKNRISSAVSSLLTPIEHVEMRLVGTKLRNIWIFKCVCGSEMEGRLDKYNSGRLKSCGCRGVDEYGNPICSRGKPSGEVHRYGQKERTLQNTKFD